MLSDLTGLTVHAKDVAPVVAQGMDFLGEIAFGRYAMIVPGALMRLQVRRIDLCDRELFDWAEDATAWLGGNDLVASGQRAATPVTARP